MRRIIYVVQINYMKILKINIKKIPDLLIEDYLILKYLYDKDYDQFEEIVDNIDDFESKKISLEYNQWIKLTGDDPRDWMLRQKTKDLFKDSIDNYKKDAEDIFNFYKETHDKHSGKKSRIKFSTNKDLLIKRLKNGVTLEGAKSVIRYKFKEWWYSDYRKHLNSFATLLGATHYDSYLTQAELDEDSCSGDEIVDRM